MPLITSFSTGSGGSYTFGWTPADVTSDTAGNIVSGVELTVWTTAARTEQVTELFDADGVTPLAGGVVRSDATGRFGFVASDAFAVLYVWAGYGPAWPVLAHEVLDSAVARSAEAVTAAQAAQAAAADAVPANPTLSVSYNTDGTVSSTTENGVVTSFTYNTDGTVATQTRAGVTRTFTYSDGNVTGAA